MRKIPIKTIYKIMNPNKTFFGFDSIHDFLSTTVGYVSIKLNIYFGILASIITFITSYIYNDYHAVFFMVFLLAVDCFTGIWKSFKLKTFTSRRMPRVLVTMLFYVVLLSISWNAAKFSPIFIWLPGVIYGGLISTSIVSIMENIHAIGYLPDSIWLVIKQKLKIKNWLDSNKKEK